jgi:hypothetical protein
MGVPSYVQTFVFKRKRRNLPFAFNVRLTLGREGQKSGKFHNKHEEVEIEVSRFWHGAETPVVHPTSNNDTSKIDRVAAAHRFDLKARGAAGSCWILSIGPSDGARAPTTF